MEQFTLHHLALYGKGWYKRENKRSLWDDLKIIMSLDGYNGEHMNKFDIVYVTLSQCQLLNLNAFRNLVTFAEGISEANCWKVGYYTKNNGHILLSSKIKEAPEYDYYEAIMRYCLSNLCHASVIALVGEGNRLPKPDYTKGLPRKNGITNKKIKEMFV